MTHEADGGPYRIDPSDCGCTDCITGYSRPAKDGEEEGMILSSGKTIDAIFRQAQDVLREKNDKAGAELLMALYTDAAIEILACLDPRHGTTAAEATKVVFEAPPYREALVWAKELTR